MSLSSIYAIPIWPKVGKHPKARSFKIG